MSDAAFALGAYLDDTGERIDVVELLVGEVGVGRRREVLVELLDRRCADECRGHAPRTEDPRDRHLREGLLAFLGDVGETLQASDVVLGQHALVEAATIDGSLDRVVAEVAIREQALGQR